ncbi:MAG: heavy metal translocating P-type ATPase metal-binding domain-containing protein [Flavobacteriales bacterium]|nr:heavy metal translocating P-type ATPase metal-binding domain-containing protein [Flavobacteriales bacterium]
MSQEKVKCYHCGADCPDDSINIGDKIFCCNGCKTVYEILNENEMCSYYNIEDMPGITPKGKFKGRFDFLSNEEISNSLLDFSDDGVSIVSFFTPSMHCSSCIWLLENLNKLNPSIISSQVNFPKKTVRVTYNEAKTTLQDVAELMAAIGYEPVVNLNDLEKDKHKVDRTIIYQVAVAGFAFGNIMLLALPEYFEVKEFWLDQFKPFFRWIMLLFSIPVLLYSAKDYFISAYKGLKHGFINIDVPIVLGIAVLFVRSTYEVVSHTGSGYFDSLTGLVFFLLLGKFFQDKTYKALSFDRDYKSYFPVAVTRVNGEKEENIQVSKLNVGDRILIRNEELIPADCVLIKGEAMIDNSFVTGESKPVLKITGDKIFAGGKQLGEAIELDIIKTVSQSYLTQLWNHDVFSKDNSKNFKSLTDSISKYFTFFILALAFGAATYWYLTDHLKVAINVFTAVLIVACPCALALSSPFTMGNVLRIFGRNRFYVKNAETLEEMAMIDHVVFDKTGTITQNDKSKITFIGEKLNGDESKILKSILRQSNHPLSRTLYDSIFALGSSDVSTFEEIVGKGIKAIADKDVYLVGSSTLVGDDVNDGKNQTRVYVKINNDIRGYYLFENTYRDNLKEVFDSFNNVDISILSGDNSGEKSNLETLTPQGTELFFNQNPEGKLIFIKEIQSKNKKVMMVGDGLNDAGALMQSNVGVTVSDNINSFSPACDAILDSEVFDKFPIFIKVTYQARQVVIASFILSLVYNSIGLYFAVSGLLSPIIAAILMPVSSISVVAFVTLVTNILAKRNSLD